MADDPEETEEKVEPRSGVSGIPQVALTDITDGDRHKELDTYESHYRLTQDNDKMYDWNGYFRGYGPLAAIKPGWYVPLSMRKPATVMPLARFIVTRLTSMTFGVDNQPMITVEGDEDAENYARALSKESNLLIRMIEARDLGGACGSVAVSYGFVEGDPRVEIHNPKHCRVLRWVDRSDLIVGAFIKTYGYDEEEIGGETQKPVRRRYFYARYIDETQDLVWSKIPEHIARVSEWSTLVEPDRTAQVIGGECPVVWIQNRPQSSGAEPPRAPYDGDSDYEGMCDDLDEINRLKSATSKGTIANVDPTLVIKDDKAGNTGSVRKGSQAAIYSKGGAAYLTLPGDAMTAAKEQLAQQRADVLDASGVVAPPAETLAASAKSAAALRILFAPMTAVCSILRAQYGDGIERILSGFLRMARASIGAGQAVELPDRFELEEPDEDDDEGETVETWVQQTPGESERISLAWPPYFSPTWTDKKMAVEAAKAASGATRLVSQKTAVEAIAPLFGVEDPSAELEEIENDSNTELDRELDVFNGARAFAAKPIEDDEEEGAGARPDGGPGSKEPETGGG